MSRMKAIARATDYFDKGTFKSELARRVAIPTESQSPERAAELARYIDTEMRSALGALGFSCRVLKHAKAPGPFLYAERIAGGRPACRPRSVTATVTSFAGSRADGRRGSSRGG